MSMATNISPINSRAFQLIDLPPQGNRFQQCTITISRGSKKEPNLAFSENLTLLNVNGFGECPGGSLLLAGARECSASRGRLTENGAPSDKGAPFFAYRDPAS